MLRAFLVAQMVDPTWDVETWVWSMSWEGPLEESMASSWSMSLAEILMDKEADPQSYQKWDWWATKHNTFCSMLMSILSCSYSYFWLISLWHGLVIEMSPNL